MAKKQETEADIARGFYREHGARVREHYCHAREKRPHFCDWVAPNAVKPEEVERVQRILERVSLRLDDAEARHMVGWDDLLDLAMWQVFDALVRGDEESAVNLLYDMAATCLRTVDVLEGRQRLRITTEKGVEE